MSLAGYDRLEHLRQALFWEPDTPIMIVSVKPYTTHADDSGKRTESLVVVAGYMAWSENWARLQKKWLPKIQKRGLREFKRSSYDIKRFGSEFLTELIDLIYGHVAYGFAYGVYCDEWRNVAREYAMELLHLVPYSICARTCIGAVREWCAQNKVDSDRMAYVFDMGSEDAGELIELLKLDDSRDARRAMRSVSSADSEEIAGLQASDFLACEMHNQYLIDPDPKDWSKFTPELKYLLEDRPVFRETGKVPKLGIYGTEALERLCVNAGVPLIKNVPAE